MAHRAPIVLVSYSSSWKQLFDAERHQLLAIFDGHDVRIEHVGSTSVPGLGAKPIVDIMLGADALSTIEAKIAALEACGYEYVPEHERVLPERRYFGKPRTRPRAFHLHAVQHGTRFWNDHIAFRDALRADAALAAQYFAVKSELAARCGDDRERYTEGKSSFIQSVLSRAAVDAH